MEAGKLYQFNRYYWLLYPSRDIAGVAAETSMKCGTAAGADNWANYWSEQLNCNVSFIELNSMFMLLEQDGKFCKVLSTEGSMGWIIYPENEAWTKGCIEEVKENSQ